MNNEKLGAAPQMYAGGDAKQAIEFAWPYHCFYVDVLVHVCISVYAGLPGRPVIYDWWDISCYKIKFIYLFIYQYHSAAHAVWSTSAHALCTTQGPRCCQQWAQLSQPRPLLRRQLPPLQALQCTWASSVPRCEYFCTWSSTHLV